MPESRRDRAYDIRLFRHWAPVYDWIELLIGPLRGAVAQKIRKKQAKILDIACGTGSQSVAFARRGFSVVGVDLSPDMLRHAKRKIRPGYKLKFICADATNTRYPDSTFDASCLSFGLHDMPEAVGMRILREMIRTTKRNGQILIVDYAKPNTGIGSRIPKLWESKYYPHFRESGLEHYLDAVHLKSCFRETHLLGNLQIVECINEK